MTETVGSSAWLRRVFEEEARDDLFAGHAPQEQPVLVLLGGHPQRRMFRLARVDAPPPEAEAARQEFRAHQGDHVLLLEAVLVGDGLEGRAVFPRHLDDAVLVFGAEARLRWGALGFALLLFLQEAGQ